ncbi:MAG: nucleotide sugar dehydrogenase [Anaerolineae bacterium]|nr:nucleotide sugar dehydrogenase [Thermoflexales bacterium]MDW8406591.1 nucleotide sugar dehydrogenase [Anaerolineae bacterium]
MEAQNQSRRSDQRVAVIGLGYVGLPLAIAFARRGRHVIGIDLDGRKVSQLNSRSSYIPDVPVAEVAGAVEAGCFEATADYDRLRDRDAIFICVPTPYDAMRAPDLSFIVSATEGIQSRLQRGQMVILQSTTYPGTTEEIVLPILEKSGLKCGADFDLAFSPERIDPGRTDFTVANTPKVVGGVTPAATQRAAELLGVMGAPIVPVSSPRAAEMTKLLENIFRSVNIALVNELARLCERMNIDIWEVINAAKTKPFGYMPFTPGPGVGGHCIGVDPYYLSWKAREFDFYTRFIELAAEVNQSMPFHVIDLTEEALSDIGVPLRGAHVLVLGVAFKRDIDDARNSPSERIIELLMNRGAHVTYHDPYVPRFQVGGDVFHRTVKSLVSQPLTEANLKAADCVIIATGHRSIDYGYVVRHAKAVVDCCNATASVKEERSKIIRLGSGVRG